MFLWERFGALSQVLVEFKPMQPQKVIVDGVEREKTSHYKPWALRWFGLQSLRKQGSL